MTQYLTVPARRTSLSLERPPLSISLDNMKRESEDDSSSNEEPNNDSKKESVNSNTIVNICVGGSLFRTYERTLKCIPKLANLDESSPHYISSREEYFFDRNPEIFQSLLDYHRLGEVRIPRTMCAASVQEELKYWGLDETCLSKSCKKYLHESLDEVNTDNIRQQKLEDLSDKAYLDESSRPTFQTSKDLSTWRNTVWQFLNDFHSSIAAKMWEILYLFLIIVSIGTFFLETLPSCRTPVHQYNNSDNGSLLISQRNEHAHNWKITMLIDTHPHLGLRIADLSCLVFFTLEFLLRFFVCPQRLGLLKKVSTVVDLLYLIPSWFITITDWVDGLFWQRGDRMHAIIILQVLKVFRVVRMARFVRHCRGLRMLCLALKDSKVELFLLGVLVTFAMTIFAALIYYAEIFNPDSFDSAFIGLWWAIITLTTVGYGDYYPESWQGYFVGSLCALTGMIVTAIPVSIITSNFHAYYGLRPPHDTRMEAKSIKPKNSRKKKKKKRKKRKCLK